VSSRQTTIGSAPERNVGIMLLAQFQICSVKSSLGSKGSFE
jgi:hypothetical protein